MPIIRAGGAAASALALVVLSLGFARDAAAADWPQWRGPDRSGVSAETGLAKDWPEGGPKLLWRIDDLGSGYSSLAVADGRLYTMGKRDEGDFVVAFDATDGKELWATLIAPRYSNDRGGGPRSTPTVDGDRLYALDAGGELVCLATKNGKTIWRVNLIDELGGVDIKWGLSESPLVDGDHVIVATGSPEGSIVALKKKNGKLVWRSKEVTDEPGYASALVTEIAGVRQIVHFTSQAVVGVRASDGKLLWRNERPANDTANCATPIVDGDQVFATSGYDTGGALLRIEGDGDALQAEEVYFTRQMQNHHGGVVLVDGHLYGFSGLGLTCIELATGKGKWRRRSVGKGSLIAADGMLYVFSEKGLVALVEADPEGYVEKSRFAIDRNHKNWAHPVISDGRLFIRSRKTIYAYDVRADQE